MKFNEIWWGEWWCISVLRVISEIASDNNYDDRLYF
jgi:hypothetical protein